MPAFAQSFSPRAALAPAAAGVLALAFAYAWAAFAWQAGLASFADDSVSYLVLAQVFSPWREASLPVAEAFVREAFYPPLFPLLLAVLGAAHDIGYAHLITAGLLAACVPVAYLLGARWLGERWAALGAVGAFALLPSNWIHIKGILSEPLYCLLLLATLLALEADQSERRWRVGAALAMAALALTRTAGLVLVVAYALWALTRRDCPLRARLRALAPALVAFTTFAVWIAWRPAGTADANLEHVLDRLQALHGETDALAALLGGFRAQIGSIAEAWTSALILFWVEGAPARVVLAGAVGLAALAGLVQRIAEGRADGWIMAAYLATYVAWPFHDQMTRFLFPALPVLVLYAFLAVAAAMRRIRRPALAGQGLLAVLMLSLALPALAFIHQRANAPERSVEITDWYRTPDLDEARWRARIHLDLMADMDAIRGLTGSQQRVMWVVPSYLALLAERRGVPAPPAGLTPDAYRRAVQAAAPDYVFLSRYHPRDTLREVAWQTGTRALAGRFEVVHARRLQGSDELASVLLKTATGVAARARKQP
jgi:hypothetical protein